MSPAVVVAWCVAAPGASGVAGGAAGLLVGVAEHPGDDRRRSLKDQVSERSGPAVEGGDLVVS